MGEVEGGGIEEGADMWGSSAVVVSHEAQSALGKKICWWEFLRKMGRSVKPWE